MEITCLNCTRTNPVCTIISPSQILTGTKLTLYDDEDKSSRATLSTLTVLALSLSSRVELERE